MKAIITLTGRDRIGILAEITEYIGSRLCNIEDISQTIMQGNFVMIMVIDLDGSPHSFAEIKDGLEKIYENSDLTVHVQRTEIFDRMHRI